jgi:cyclopropane-fatty-acyl-phospholipid synthase
VASSGTSDLSQPAPRRLSQQWARHTVHALLAKLQHGALTVQEDDQCWHFGEARPQASSKATLVIKQPAAYLSLVRAGEVGAGEAYIQGMWDSPDLVALIRLFAANMAIVRNMQPAFWQSIGQKMFHWLRRNSKARAKTNIAAHYDLSNDFFRLFLDNTMAYSSGIFLHKTATLEQASLAKFRRICEQLQLQATDHLLEIGTGWGGLAIFAAKHYGCRVTTTTISHQQYSHAKDWVAREGLQDRITLLEQDYRDLGGQYDKLVSIEMIEAVGAEFYPRYFAQCSQLLKPHGLMMLQAITISDQRYQHSLHSTDFIKRYIFPGGQLPCNAAITQQVALHTDMQLINLHDISLDYAHTLQAWRERFHQQYAAVRQLGYDDSFIRMWQYYFCYCEAGFLERVIHTGQFLLAKPLYRP